MNSDFIPSLFLDLIASEKFENILEVNKFFNFIKSPVAKELKMLSYAISAPLKNSFLSLPSEFQGFA